MITNLDCQLAEIAAADATDYERYRAYVALLKELEPGTNDFEHVWKVVETCEWKKQQRDAIQNGKA